MHIALNLGPQKQLNEDIQDNLKNEEKIGDQNAEPTTQTAEADSPKKGEKKKKDEKEEKKEEAKATSTPPEEQKDGHHCSRHSRSNKGTPPKDEANQGENVMIT